jgi:hypothetical protein
MNNTLSYLLVSPEALRRGWTGWILAGATARTGGLDLVWAGLVEAPAGRSGLLVFRGEDAAPKLAAAVGSAKDAGSLAGMLGDGMMSAPKPGNDVVGELTNLAATQVDALAQHGDLRVVAGQHLQLGQLDLEDPLHLGEIQ